jgi:hypothetical protein
MRVMVIVFDADVEYQRVMDGVTCLSAWLLELRSSLEPFHSNEHLKFQKEDLVGSQGALASLQSWSNASTAAARQTEQQAIPT